MVGLIAAGQGTAADIGVGALIGAARGPAGPARRAAERELAMLLRVETRRAARVVTRSGGRRAEDLAADAAHTVWLNVVDHFDPQGCWRVAWLRARSGQARRHRRLRTAHAQRRGGGAVPAALDEDVIPGKSPDPEAQAIARDTVRRALDSLPDAHRSVVLRVLRGEPQNEIAASLGRHPSQVTRLVQRVVAWLGGAR